MNLNIKSDCSLCTRPAPGCPWAPGWVTWPGCPASARRSRCGAGWRTPRWRGRGQTTSAATASSQTTSTTPAQTSPSSPPVNNVCHLPHRSPHLACYLQISLLLWFYLWNLNAMMRFLFLINWLLLAEKCVLSPLESVGLSVLHNCQLILESSQ